jgi:mRNA-degrading endonuclease RelE of RelBE toxin-antitoxin system
VAATRPRTQSGKIVPSSSCAIDRYLASRAGDVKKLKPPRTGFRLRSGDYRVFFDPKDDTTIEITGVRNRREAYR